MFEAASGFLATRAIAGGSQNRPTDCLQFHLAASAYLGEVLLLFLVHCDRPFVDSVYEVILALARNVRNGVKNGNGPGLAACPFYPGGLNRSTQHFILKERWSVV
jgi:hypothetical protein